MNINAKQIAKMYNILDVIFKSNFWVLLNLVITSNGSQLGDAGFSVVIVQPVAFS